MSELLKKLLHLHEIDPLARRTREQLAAYPRMLAALDAAEAAQRKIIDESRRRAEQAALERRQAERSVHDLREKIARTPASSRP